MSGGGTGTSKDQLALQNKLTQEELDQQQALRDQITSNFGKYLSGNVGFDPATMAAMQSQFLNNNTNNFNQAGQQVLAGLNARGAGGGQLPAGGDLARALSSLQGARASSQSQGILGLNVTNAQQALANQFNTGSLYAGQAAQLGSNIGTFNEGANNALKQYVAASQNGFMSQLGKSLGAGIGGGLGAIATGGIGAALGGLSNLGGSVASSAGNSVGTGLGGMLGGF